MNPEYENCSIRVPLALDAEIKMPIGPFRPSIRTAVLMAAVLPLCYLVYLLGFVSLGSRMAICAAMVASAAGGGALRREGIWLGLHAMYAKVGQWMPSVVSRGIASRGRVRLLDDAVDVRCGLPTLRPTGRLSSVGYYTSIPRAKYLADSGLLEMTPGGYRVLLAVEGPAAGLNSPQYRQWCVGLVQLVLSVGCPAQVITVADHYDEDVAGEMFDERCGGWKPSLLLKYERRLAVGIAKSSLQLKHYLVFAPKTAGKDGVPYLSRLHTAHKARDVSLVAAEEALHSALSNASGVGIAIGPPTVEEAAKLLNRTVVGAEEATVLPDSVLIGKDHHVIATVTKLPAHLRVGDMVEAMLRAPSCGVVSVFLNPVATEVAQKMLRRQLAARTYSEQMGNDDIANSQAAQDVVGVQAALAQRDILPFQLAVTFSTFSRYRDEALKASARLNAVLEGKSFEVTPATRPGFLPALALSPGCAPLGRSLQLTVDAAVLRVLPVLGTPFSDARQPLLGENQVTGAPVHYSTWAQPNHNLVVCASSGAGKSVALKTMLIRHCMEGDRAVVIDPDSEYEAAIGALGGRYFELGRDSLNVLSVATIYAPDIAAGHAVTVLSVLGGDEKGLQDGKPIRRLPDEDQGWLHTEVASFMARWLEARPELAPGDEPVLHELVEFLEDVSAPRLLEGRRVQQQERCLMIAARLRRYTQGTLARVFDRPSTFAIGDVPVGIGLKEFALSYQSDLTPALAVVLTAIFGAIDPSGRQAGAGKRMIIVVDEAHHLTSDPDAGRVLDQLVRKARKRGAGVWMASQKIDDFVSTDLGRTLASAAGTKLVLGVEELVMEHARTGFHLKDEEMAALNPVVQGRGVLIAGAERAVVHIVPGDVILALANTTPEGLRNEPAA